jgi:transcriptional regulator GlxA family with amidase domain
MEKVPSGNILNVGILIFDDVELLDFAGPFEVFSRTRLQPGIESRRSSEGAPFNVYTVTRISGPVIATGGLEIQPRYDFTNCPPVDLLVVPGGWGTRRLLDCEETLSWIKRVAESGAKITSVCTGALLLAKVGLLKNKSATTHWGALETLAALDPTIQVCKERYIDHGIVTSAGISAGIDMALYVVSKLLGPEVSADTARYMEYSSPSNSRATPAP